MTTLDQTDPAQRSVPVPVPAPSGPAATPVPTEPAPTEPAPPAATTAVCSIAAVGEPCARPVRDDSVPRPRAGDGGVDGHPDAAPVGGGATGGNGKVDAGAAGGGAAGGGAAGGSADTTARLRAGLAARLRAAYEQGRPVGELAVACRRSVAETRALLVEAGVLLPPAVTGGADRAGTADGSGRGDRPGRTTGAGAAAAVLRSAQEELRTVRTRRPSPSRRLSRMHPQVAAAQTRARTAALEAADEAVGATVRPRAAEADGTDGTGVTVAGTGVTDATVPDGAGPVAETPLGILIGGTPQLPEPTGRPEELRPLRVNARLVRAGRGTCMVVLPAWRPAIAVSVPTEQLLDATGLDLDGLAGAQLSVLINPEALHDRELGLHDWRTGPATRAGGRRGGGRKS
ncbi:hypothetical protein ACWEQL_36775 [Kitasatospora sp. NPDC004240]